ncbi:hypothetical protein EWM64_g1580 [Hericium alpestre]|uniref:Gluconokinase n=1 Tax=Hericium alpestre TaxID=135208 RepID=A0A4Z0A832_9AGAM|nr:hypothetical protein EWM64_g1580 [Hericium alpestre]
MAAPEDPEVTADVSSAPAPAAEDFAKDRVAGERLTDPVSLNVHAAEVSPCMIVGVSGSGKSTLGQALAASLSLPFLDGDDLHPLSNIEKMSRGEPLTDADRAPWLVHIREEGSSTVREKQTAGVVVACSALKRRYRDVLRGERVGLDDNKGQEESEVVRRAGETEPGAGGSEGPTASGHLERPSDLRTFFVHPHGTRDVLLSRMESRKGHFFKAAMLDTQLATLEVPALSGEDGIVQVDLEHDTQRQVEEARAGLSKWIIM